MLGSALYYPHIDINDPIWLRSAILFWDEIQTISPSVIENPYRNIDTKICADEGYLRPLHCDLHKNVINDLGRKIIALTSIESRRIFSRSVQENPVFSSIKVAGQLGADIEDTFSEVGIHPQKMSPEIAEFAMRFGLARMHQGKMPRELRRVFEDLWMARLHPTKVPEFLRSLMRESQSYHDRDGEWLLVDGRFAEAYMAALAAKLSQQMELSPLTSYESAQGLSFRFMFDELVDDSPQSAHGAMIGVVMRGLKVDPSVPVINLIKFREDRKDQYQDFAGKINALTEQLENADPNDSRELLEKAKDSYSRDIEPSLRALKRELDQNFISTLWEGAYRAITISVPSAGALAFFTGLAGPALLGAGAALAAADIGVRSYLAGRKLRLGNPYSYLHDINENFGLPKFLDT